MGRELAELGLALVMAAFHPGERSPITPMSNYRGKGKAQGSKKISRSPPVSGLSGTRVHATETSSAKFSKPIPVEMSGRTLRAIATLDPMYQNWINHRYRSPGENKRESGESFFRLFAADYLAENGDNLRTSTRCWILKMIRIQIYYSGAPYWYSAAKPNELPDFQEISIHSWAKTYAKHWKKIDDQMKSIDFYSLSEIARRA